MKLKKWGELSLMSDFLYTLKFFIAMIPLAIPFSIFPGSIQFTLYSIAKLIFKNGFRPLYYSIVLLINTIICGRVSFWIFINDDDDMLAGFAGGMIGVAWGWALFVMLIYNIIQYKKAFAKKQQITKD